MIGWLIVACEIGFWVFILAGLISRYIFKKKTLSAILLICTPITDLVLLSATVVDMMNGATASTMHGLAAVYLGVSVAYGRQMVQWADRQFAYRFGQGTKPLKTKKYGMEHAKIERAGWYRHLLAWSIGCVILGAITWMVDRDFQTLHDAMANFRDGEHNNHDQYPTMALVQTMLLWTVILAVDFVISFSYTLFPKKNPNQP